MDADERLKERIRKVTSEEVSIIPYDPSWVSMFLEERDNLISCLPEGLIRRIEHFGSTAVPGMCAKPIVDILVEVSSLDETKRVIVPILESRGYDYFWRPVVGEDPPFYAWFIKRDIGGKRTHHIHMVEADSELWDRLYFRDYLKEFPETRKDYMDLKYRLAKEFPNDRVAYTKAKTEFITRVTREAKEYYSGIGVQHNHLREVHSHTNKTSRR